MNRSLVPVAPVDLAELARWSSPAYQPYTLAVPGDQIQTKGRPWADIQRIDACTHPYHEMGCTLLHRQAPSPDGPVFLPPVHCTTGTYLWIRREVTG